MTPQTVVLFMVLFLIFDNRLYKVQLAFTGILHQKSLMLLLELSS